MEQQANSNQNVPTLCRAGCGFYGSSSMDGMCSKCYKDALNRKMQPPSTSNSSSTVATPAVNITSPGGTSAVASSASTGSLAPSGPGSNSSLLDLSTSPVDISTANSSLFSSSMPTHIANHMPHPSSSININMNTPGSQLTDGGLSASPSSSSLPGSFTDPSSPMSEGTKKKNRCAECNKKVGLTGFDCRCGGTFCPQHRYHDMHKCTFDYKEMGANEIRKNNPAVRGEKVQKL